MNTSTNTSRPATAAEAIATLFADDTSGLPNARGALEILLEISRDDATYCEDQMRRPAAILTQPAPEHTIRRALREIVELGAKYEAARNIERQAAIKLRVVEQVERLYAE